MKWNDEADDRSTMDPIWLGTTSYTMYVDYMKEGWWWRVYKGEQIPEGFVVGQVRSAYEIDRTTAKREAELWLRQNVL